MISIGGAAKGSHPPPEHIDTASDVASFALFCGVTLSDRYSLKKTAAAGSPVSADKSEPKNTTPNLPVYFSTTVIIATMWCTVQLAKDMMPYRVNASPIGQC